METYQSIQNSVISYGTNTATVIDDLSYTYHGNQATNINDLSNNFAGYEGGGWPIDYDANGNMTRMLDKGIFGIEYNHLSLPNSISIDRNGYENLYTTTLYKADGSKLRKNTVSTVTGFRNSTVTTEITDYLDGFQYKNTKMEVLGGGSPGDLELLLVAPVETSRAMEIEAFSLEDLIEPADPRIINPIGGITATVKTQDLQFFPTAEGFYDYQKDQYIYQYKDHLGNARVSFGRNSAGVLEITDANDYYPFGMNHLKTGNAFFGGSYKAYKYQGQELQETGFYSFKWRNYMPDVGRFFNIDPLAEKYPYNSTYAFQENKLGLGVELEGLELLKSQTGFFAIHGNAMKVKRAPMSQTNSNGQATFTAGDVGLTTSGYNPNGARISSGTTGLRQDSYKYDGPVADVVQMQNTRDKISTKVRQSFKTTKTGSEMWNLKQQAADNAISASSGVKELVKLGKLAVNIPDAFKSLNEYTQAVKDVQTVQAQAMTMDQAIKYVDGSGIDMNTQTRNNVVNFVFDGTLPPGTDTQNGLIIQNGLQILRNNNITVQPSPEQEETNRKIRQ